MATDTQYALLDCKDDVDFLIVNNLGLADYMANKFNWTGVEDDDLVQLARLGLVKAAHGYKPELGIKFSSYACKVMWAIILREVYGNQDIPKRRIQPKMVSMETPISDTGGVFLKDAFAADEDGFEHVENQMFVEQLTKGMTEFQQEVLHERFVECKPRHEIAKAHGKSHEWIRIVEKQCIEKMRIRAGYYHSA